MSPKRRVRKVNGHMPTPPVDITERICTTSGKVRFRTREEANKSALTKPVPCDVYRCSACRSYHLTSRRECEKPPLALRRYPGRAVSE